MNKVKDSVVECVPVTDERIEDRLVRLGRFVAVFEVSACFNQLRTSQTLWFDFIYCAGPFDYLPDLMCKASVNLFFERWLRRSGLVLVANMNDSNPFCPAQGWDHSRTFSWSEGTEAIHG